MRVIFGMNLQGIATTTVTFNGVAATIVYSSATQINVIVPSKPYQYGGKRGGDGRRTGQQSVPSESCDTRQASSANGVLNFADGQTNTAADPVTRGNFVVVYLTGLITPLTGPVTVTIGGQTGLMPSLRGAPRYLSQRKSGQHHGSACHCPRHRIRFPLTVCVGTVCSNSVNVYIQ